MANRIQKVGIVGAGVMGQGIAQVCAVSGYEVLLYDLNAELISNGIAAIEKSLQISVDKNKITKEQKQNALQRIKSCTVLPQLKADLIIEAAVESLEIKREIFKALEDANSDICLLVTNTSSISITKIASVLERPQQFAGLHFFNPAHIMKLVEVVEGVDTSSDTVAALKIFSESLGKTPVLTKDSPGFIVNRVARHYYVEALKLAEENAAELKTIDALMKSSGFKMGPFELMDLIGLDTNFAVTNSVYNGFHQDPKFRPSRIQQQKVEAGHLGKKTGKGFYDYK
jgi:3-hydroxybutyryl-CoA dehydrogenase